MVRRGISSGRSEVNRSVMALSIFLHSFHSASHHFGNAPNVVLDNREEPCITVSTVPVADRALAACCRSPKAVFATGCQRNGMPGEIACRWRLSENHLQRELQRAGRLLRSHLTEST